MSPFSQALPVKVPMAFKEESGRQEKTVCRAMGLLLGTAAARGTTAPETMAETAVVQRPRALRALDSSLEKVERLACGARWAQKASPVMPADMVIPVDMFVALSGCLVLALEETSVGPALVAAAVVVVVESPAAVAVVEVAVAWVGCPDLAATVPLD